VGVRARRHDRSDSPWAYPALLVLGAVDAAGYSVIAPAVPAIAAATGAGPTVVGALVGSFPAGMLLGFWCAGRALRRWRPDAVIGVSLVVLAIACLGFVVGEGLPIYFVARAVMGLGSGGLWMGVTFSTLERWPGQEYLCMSRIFAAYAVGGLIGPALGGLGGIRLPFAALLTLFIACGAAAAVVGSPRTSGAFRADRDALRRRSFWMAAAGILFAVLALGMIEGVLPLHFAERLNQAQIGALYVVSGLIVAAASAIAGSFAPRRMLAAALGLVVAGIALAGAADHVALWLAALALAAIGLGIGQTGSLGVLLESASPERMILAMVLWSQLGILGYLIGPLAGGLVAQTLGFAALGLVPLIAAVIVALAWAPAAAGALD
jgi:MFS family permease